MYYITSKSDLLENKYIYTIFSQNSLANLLAKERQKIGNKDKQTLEIFSIICLDLHIIEKK